MSYVVSRNITESLWSTSVQGCLNQMKPGPWSSGSWRAHISSTSAAYLYVLIFVLILSLMIGIRASLSAIRAKWRKVTSPPAIKWTLSTLFWLPMGICFTEMGYTLKTISGRSMQVRFLVLGLSDKIGHEELMFWCFTS